MANPVSINDQTNNYSAEVTSGRALRVTGIGTSGSTPVTPGAGGSATDTLSNVASSATSVPILAANTSRIGAAVYNDSTAVLYLKLNAGTASATSYTVQLSPNAYYEVPFGYVGAITGIWASANGSARVSEFAP